MSSAFMKASSKIMFAEASWCRKTSCSSNVVVICGCQSPSEGIVGELLHHIYRTAPHLPSLGLKEIIMSGNWIVLRTSSSSSPIKALFRSKKFLDFDTIVILFLFDKHCLINGVTRFKNFISRFIDKLYN